MDVPFELAADFEIEARPEHEPRLLAMLRFLLVNREQPAPFAVREDPTRRGFYDIESEGRVYFIFVTPNGKRVLLLATWLRREGEAAKRVAG